MIKMKMRIVRTFVPLLPSTQREEVAITNTLNRIQNNKNDPVTWPHIADNPINEFQTQGYIVRAFPTLYPTGNADLLAERIKEIKPTGRFARHTRWRYFALNSQMRW